MSSGTRQTPRWSPFTTSIRDAYPGQMIVADKDAARTQPMHEYELELRRDFSRYLNHLETSPLVTVQIPVDGKAGITRPFNYFGFFSPRQELPPALGAIKSSYVAQSSIEENLEDLSTRLIDRVFLKTLRELHIPEPRIVTCSFKNSDSLPAVKAELASFDSLTAAREHKAAVSSDAFFQLFLQNLDQDRQILHEQLGHAVDIDWFERLSHNQIITTKDKGGNPYCYFVARDANAPDTYDPDKVRYRHHTLSPTDQVIVEACLMANIQAPDIQAQYTEDNQFIGVAYLFTREDQAQRFQQFISDPVRVAEAVQMLDIQVGHTMAQRARDRAPTPQGDEPDKRARAIEAGGVVAGATSKAIH